MFDLTVDWWEIIVRVSLIYAFLLVLLRVAGKREIGQLGPMELLTILLISETVSPALTNEDTSVSAAMIASGTLVVLSFLIALATYASRKLERVIEGKARTVIEKGELLQDVKRAERITDSDLEAALRKHGLRTLGDVDHGVVETTGEITLIKRGE